MSERKRGEREMSFGEMCKRNIGGVLVLIMGRCGLWVWHDTEGKGKIYTYLYKNYIFHIKIYIFIFKKF